jgi:hypothetical protein
MKRFSERKGYKKVSDVIQTGAMSDELRNGVWNVLYEFVWLRTGFMSSGPLTGDIQAFSRALWQDYFKKPADQRPDSEAALMKKIDDYFFGAQWYEVYDFLEFVLSHEHEDRWLAEQLNAVLERELSGYRIVDGKAVGITDEQEVQMLEKALGDTEHEGVTAHLRRALELLSDRKNPDYRNSIKESISAVESMARVITGERKATLGDALKTLEKNGKLHHALRDGFSKLYGYTNDEGCLRHAMLEEPDITGADAKYFLLSCTSFINYLKAMM